MSTRFEAVNNERAGRDALLGTNVTLGGRFRINALPSAGNYGSIVTRNISFTGWEILVDDAGHLRIQLLNSAVLSAAGPTALAINTWYYLWIRQVAAGPGTVFIYLDASTTPELTSATDFFNPGARIEFATATSTGTPRYLDCSLDGWKVWSSNLAASNAAIEDGAHKATTTANLLAEYFFDGTDVTDHSGNGNDLTAFGTLSAGPDSPIDGTPATATQLVITTQPSASATSGVALAQQPIVQVRDVSNVLVASSLASVTASIASGAGVLSGTTTVDVVGGIATFTDLVITGASVDTIIFTSAGLSSATSGAVTVSSAVATKLGITTQPSASALTGVPFARQPIVQTQDPSGALISTSASVTASIASGAGVLSGTTTVVAIGGIATFTDLKVTGISVDTIQFTSSGLTPITSATVNVVAPTAHHLGITTQPSDGSTGAALPIQPVIQIQDESGALFPNTASVTVALASGPGALSGTLTVAAIAGVATFTDLVITGVGLFSLVFTSPGLIGATTPTIIIGPQFPTFVQLTATPRDVLGNPIVGQPITYSSSDITVAVVNLTGGVYAVAPGTAQITAICGGKRSNVAVVTVT